MRYDTNSGRIEVTEDTYNGDIGIIITSFGDACTDDNEVSIMIDHHQAQQLAISILGMIDVHDTRGSK